MYINFDEISSQDEKETLGKPFIIFIVALFVLSLGLIVFFIWRWVISIFYNNFTVLVTLIPGIRVKCIAYKNNIIT